MKYKIGTRVADQSSWRNIKLSKPVKKSEKQPSKRPTCGGTRNKPRTFGGGFDYIEGFDCTNKEYHR